LATAGQYGYKILHITPSFPPDTGGIANHVLHLCLCLNKQGNNIQIVAPKHLSSKEIVLTEAFQHTIIRIRSFYLPGWPYPTLRSVSIPIDLGLKIDSFIRKGCFDIVHAHGHHYPISWMAIKTARKHGVPSVLTLHGMYSLNPYLLGGKTRFEELFNKYVIRRPLSNADAVIGLTKQITEFAKVLGGQESAAKYFTIPNGVNTQIYKENLPCRNEYRLKYNIQHGSIVILFRGRFEHVKGIIEFTKAAKNTVTKYQGKKVEVIIIGSGSLESEVKSIIRGIPAIHLLNWQPSDQIHELYIASDIFVNPSKAEGLPITIIEAMNACLHIVYTPVGGVPDVLEGYLPKTMLTDGSAAEIEKVLSSLIENHSFFRSKNMDDSFDYAQKFDWNNIAHNITEVYNKLISNTRK
jgi:glycosyltransferase involved in cell wall biosynthesis